VAHATRSSAETNHPSGPRWRENDTARDPLHAGSADPCTALPARRVYAWAYGYRTPAPNDKLTGKQLDALRDLGGGVGVAEPGGRSLDREDGDAAE
jgi:hypothetical protein